MPTILLNIVLNMLDELEEGLVIEIDLSVLVTGLSLRLEVEVFEVGRQIYVLIDQRQLHEGVEALLLQELLVVLGALREAEEEPDDIEKQRDVLVV